MKMKQFTITCQEKNRTGNSTLGKQRAVARELVNKHTERKTEVVGYKSAWRDKGPVTEAQRASFTSEAKPSIIQCEIPATNRLPRFYLIPSSSSYCYPSIS